MKDLIRDLLQLIAKLRYEAERGHYATGLDAAKAMQIAAETLKALYTLSVIEEAQSKIANADKSEVLQLVESIEAKARASLPQPAETKGQSVGDFAQRARSRGKEDPAAVLSRRRRKRT
jgi:hypothetical protein